MRCRHAAQRRESNFRVRARVASGDAIEEIQPVLGEYTALDRTEAEQGCLRGFGGILQGLRKLATTLEMRGKFHGGNARAGGALAFQRDTDLAVKLRAAEWR